MQPQDQDISVAGGRSGWLQGTATLRMYSGCRFGWHWRQRLEKSAPFTVQFRLLDAPATRTERAQRRSVAPGGLHTSSALAAACSPSLRSGLLCRFSSQVPPGRSPIPDSGPGSPLGFSVPARTTGGSGFGKPKPGRPHFEFSLSEVEICQWPLYDGTESTGTLNPGPGYPRTTAPPCGARHTQLKRCPRPVPRPR